MTHTRTRVAALGIVAAVAGGFAVAPTAAQAATGTDFYVDNGTTSHCNDSGPGTQAEPFCTIQAGANAASAGDTVLIENSDLNHYQGNVTISHSGTASAPITFTSVGLPGYMVGGDVTVSGSYIDITQGYFGGLRQPLTVTGSHVTFDEDQIGGDGQAALQTGSGVSNLTVERSFLDLWGSAPGIALGPGNKDAVISANAFRDSDSGPSFYNVTMSDDSGTDLTGNTIDGNCDNGFLVTGSTGTSIENNVIGEQAGGGDCTLDGGVNLLYVDAASASTTTEGYNVLDSDKASVTPYIWAGKSYTTQADFTAATGQGTADSVVAAFDTNTDSYAGDTVAAGTANANAPGELPTDLYGNAWSGTPDRGAIALKEFTGASLEAVNASPQQVAVNLALQGVAWGPSVSATINWGDGSGNQDLGLPNEMGEDFAAIISYHMYAQRGTYTVTTTVTDATQTVTKTISVTADGSTYVPVTPTRVLDTRSGKGAPSAPVAANGTVAVNVANGVTLPAGAGTITAVVMNVTVTDSTKNGFVSAYPDGTALPSTSSLNYSAGETVPNLVTVMVGPNDEVDLHNSSAGTTQLIADVAGYYVASLAGSYYLPNSPQRILDTRTTTGGHDAPVPAGGTVSLSVPACTQGSGSNAQTAPVTAAAINLTVTQPTANGFLTAYPDGATLPSASNVNFAANETVPNMSVVETGTDGKIDIHNSSNGTVEVIADLEGCYSSTLGDAFVPITPYRALDTRTGIGQESAAGGIPAQPNSDVIWWTSDDAVAPSNGTNGPTAVVMNVTVTQPTSNGVIIAYPSGSGSSRPTASNLNFAAGETVPNLVMVAVNPGFNLSLYNQSNGTTQLIADYYGYFS